VSQSKLSTSLSPPTSSGQDGQEDDIDDGARVDVMEVLFEENASITKETTLTKIHSS